MIETCQCCKSYKSQIEANKSCGTHNVSFSAFTHSSFSSFVCRPVSILSVCSPTSPAPSLPLAATFLPVWPHTGSCTVNLSRTKKGDLLRSLPVSTDVKVNLGDSLNNLPPLLSDTQIKGSLLFTRASWGFSFSCNRIFSKDNINTENIKKY